MGLETARPARKQILWPKWRESCHSVIHSVIPSLVLCTSVRHCLGIGKTAENKMKSLLPWSVYSNASVIGGVSPPRLPHCQPGRQTPDLLYLPSPPGPPCPMHLPQHRESISLPLPSRYLERTPDAACGCTYRKEAWSCSRTRQTKTQGTQAGRCHRDPQASEMVFLKVRGQMESPSLTHKAAQVLNEYYQLLGLPGL